MNQVSEDISSDTTNNALDLDAIAARNQSARDMVHALCQPRGTEGSREWMMSIPADFERDPDLIIGAALSDNAKLIAALQANESKRGTADEPLDLDWLDNDCDFAEARFGSGHVRIPSGKLRALIALARRTADAEEEQAVLEEQRDVAWLQRDHAETAEADTTRALGEATQREFAMREALTAMVNASWETGDWDITQCRYCGVADQGEDDEPVAHEDGCYVPAAEAALNGKDAEVTKEDASLAVTFEIGSNRHSREAGDPKTTLDSLCICGHTFGGHQFLGDNPCLFHGCECAGFHGVAP